MKQGLSISHKITSSKVALLFFIILNIFQLNPIDEIVG